MYDNSRGSTLLALARAGMLPTRKHRHKYQHIQPHCIKCGMDEETIPHVIMECTPHHFDEEEILRNLGLQEEMDKGRVAGTKKILEKWRPDRSAENTRS